MNISDCYITIFDPTQSLHQSLLLSLMFVRQQPQAAGLVVRERRRGEGSR